MSYYIKIIITEQLHKHEESFFRLFVIIFVNFSENFFKSEKISNTGYMDTEIHVDMKNICVN